MKTHLRFLSIVGALLTAPLASRAQSSAPVGYNIVTLKGSSDTAVGLPLHRPISFQAMVTGVTGSSVLTFAGTPFADRQFVAGNAAQVTPVDETEDPAYKGNSYYCQIASGNLNGSWFPVTANTASSITLNVGSNVITGSGDVEAGTIVKIIPYWRLPRIFPRVTGSNSAIKPTSVPVPTSASVVYVRDPAAKGINQALAQGYFYYAGTVGGGAGWRWQGGVFTTKYNDTPIAPDSVLVIRHNASGDTAFQLTGCVPTTALGSVVSTQQSGLAQDNFIPAPGLNLVTISGTSFIDLTLSQSQLIESGAVQGNSTFIPKDVLYIVDNSSVGFNKALAQGYYYYTGSANGGLGWRRQGSPVSTLFDNQKVFQPGQILVIRKAATLTPGGASWIVTPPYAQ